MTDAETAQATATWCLVKEIEGMAIKVVTIASRRTSPRAGAVVYRCKTCGKRARSRQRRVWPFGFDIAALDNWRVTATSTMTVNSKGVPLFLGLCPKHAESV